MSSTVSETSFTVGERITEGFSTGYPGEAFVITLSRDPAGLPFLLADNITEVGAGNYLISFVPELEGSYYANWLGETSQVVLDGNWAVEPGRVLPGFAGLGTSRRDLRRKIGGASGLGDYELTISTLPGNQTFTDVNRLFLPTGAYDGRELYIATGPNRGQNRYVTGNSAANRSLSVDPLFPTENPIGTEGELWNRQGSGWHYWEVDAVINDIITEARTGTWIPQTIAQTSAFDPLSPYIPIPPTFSHIFGVGWADEAGLWQAEGPADYPGGPGWFADPATGQIVLGGTAAANAASHLTQIRGYGPLAELESDDDVTPLNPEWLVKEAVSRLLLMALGRRPENQVKYPASKRRADESRGFAMHRPNPDTVRVA